MFKELNLDFGFFHTIRMMKNNNSPKPQQQINNNEIIRSKSIYLNKGEGYFVCTGVPGTGFYSRELDIKYLPVPLNMPKKNIKTVSVAEKKPVQNNPYPKIKTSDDDNQGCVFLFGLLISLTLGATLHVGFLVIGIIISVITAYFKRDAKKIEPVNNIVYRVKRTYLPVPVDNIDEYYTSTARNVLQTIDDGIEKLILQNYVNCIEKKSKSEIDVWTKLPSRIKESYKNLCEAFEDMFESSIICEDFPLEGEDPEVVEQLAMSKLSLYVGIFDFISSPVDTPVIDFGNFQFYLYPEYVIKAFDNFTFQAIDYNRISIKVDYINYKCSQRYVDSSVQQATKDGKFVNRFGRITLTVDSDKYILVISNDLAVKYFDSRWQKFINSFKL